MIISRTPFRLSFAGGGTDLPSFYKEEEGAVLSTSLNKYMYITVNKRFDDSIRLSYSHTEICETVNEISHPIFKYVMNEYAPQGGLELISMADIPSGTGLGSSSSFTVGLLNAVKHYMNTQAHKEGRPAPYSARDLFAETLAEEASDIEINKLHEPIGKQDQYIAAYGGLQYFRFTPSGKVEVEPVQCTEETRNKLEASSLLFFTGRTRDAKSVLKEQKENTDAKRDTLRTMAQLARKSKKILEENPSSLESFGKLLDEAWQLKKSVASNVSNPEINQWYDRALKAGAWGGKILGAGSGGFLMLFCEPSKQEKLRKELRELRPFDVKFERQGSCIIFSD